MGKAQQHRRRVNVIRRRIAELEAQKAVTVEEVATVRETPCVCACLCLHVCVCVCLPLPPQCKSKLDGTATALRKAVTYNQRVAAAIAKFVQEESSGEKQAEQARLKDLISLNDNLKAQEAQFKASCARQRAALKARVFVSVRLWSCVCV